MSMANHSIDSKTKGSLGESEDQWSLEVDDDTGEKSVTHSWNYTNANNSKVRSEGSRSWALKEFLVSNEPSHIKEKLQTLMREESFNA
jgi:hypothetical protein